MWKKLQILLLSLLIAGAFFFPHAGQFLIVQDDFSHADLALVLSGEAIGRTLAARDLYQMGKVDQIAVIPEPDSLFTAELIRLGLVDPDLPSWPERILTASGIPSSKVILLKAVGHQGDTVDEAQMVRDWIRQAPKRPKSLVLITGKAATRRAKFIFRQVLADAEIRLFSQPGSYDPFKPQGWWGRPKDTLWVVQEYLKFSANIVFLPFRLMKEKQA